MTQIPIEDHRLLVLFGEMRGDLKSVLRQGQEMSDRLSSYEESVDGRLAAQDKRIRALEAIKLKVAGFTTALGILVGLFADKVAGLLTEFSKLFGG